MSFPLTGPGPWPFGAGPPFGASSNSDLTLPDQAPLKAPTVVHKTVYHGANAPATITIPPTTKGNTIVIVQSSLWYPSYPVFDGIAGGWGPDGFTFTENDATHGIFGGSADFPADLRNSGSLIAYFTNIRAGITGVVYTNDFGTGHANLGGTPEWTTIYELTPCSMFDGNPKHGFLSESPIVSVPVNGPSAGTAIYIGGMYTANVPDGSFFSSVSTPWVIDEQDLFTPAGEGGCAAVAIIASGSGTQQAIWSGSSANDYFASASICLVGPAGSTSSGGIFQPNVCIVS
jgi:hypothetical protein